LNDAEPTPDKGCPEMPRGLSRCARREWHNITGQLETLGVLAVTDGKALAMYCDAYADWEQANKQCHKEGMWYSEPVVGATGMVVGFKHKQSPWFNVKVTAMKVMKSFLIEFGLTPSSRSKLRIEKKTPDAGDEAILVAREIGSAGFGRH
jgi:P27 family predicted phage terminase small subunit